ncbi:MAG: hypothetical protein EKK41_22375 [Hyphomicrobiales bacterium]|nr:MAG: hypothetical protein EKK41_22375 [Hyphomicrobiales bacterium]
MSHVVRYLMDPRSGQAREIGFETAPSYEAAVRIATRGIADLRAAHGERVGYVIEDRSGRRIRVGP